MNRNEFAEFTGTLKAYYPNGNILSGKEAVNVWFDSLKDVSLPVAKAALKKHAETSKWLPNVSDILAIVRPASKSKVRAKDFNMGEISEIDMMLIEKQKAKWGTGAELRAWCEANGLAWGGTA